VIEPLLTVEDVSRILSVPVATLYRWRATRTGPPAFKAGRELRYRSSDLERWVERQLAEDAHVEAAPAELPRFSRRRAGPSHARGRPVDGLAEITTAPGKSGEEVSP
jgi:predicted DNA-binding transcriptional regulator AlpA